MAGDRIEKHLAVEREQLRIAERAHGRRPRDVAEQARSPPPSLPGPRPSARTEDRPPALPTRRCRSGRRHPPRAKRTLPAGSVIGSSACASRSMPVGGSGAKIGIACSRSRHSFETGGLSRVRSLRQSSPVMIGRKSPVASSVDADPEEGDQERRENRAQADRAGRRALDHAEDPRPHTPSGACAAAASAPRHRPGCCRSRAPRACTRATIGSPRAPMTDERHAPQKQADAEVGREPLAADERERDDSAEHPADAARRVEPADAAAPEREQLERGDDDEHAHRPGDNRLRGVEEHDHPQPRRRAIARKPARTPSCSSLSSSPTTAVHPGHVETRRPSPPTRGT